ncbi:MAG: hypothetical protein HYX94_11860 [Chloroflexi bacterium]|nr:hypothetical protein [Chloroflexota bacterium]
MGEDDALFDQIEGFLKQQGQQAREQKLLVHGLLLSLLVLRGVTTKTQSIDVGPRDRDGELLKHYFVSPGLVPDIAQTHSEITDKGEVVHIEPDWPRIAEYFGRDLEGFRNLLEKRFPKLVRRHRFVIDMLLENEE